MSRFWSDFVLPGQVMVGPVIDTVENFEKRPCMDIYRQVRQSKLHGKFGIDPVIYAVSEDYSQSTKLEDNEVMIADAARHLAFEREGTRVIRLIGSCALEGDKQ